MAGKTFSAALRKVTIVSRGPNSAAVLSQMAIQAYGRRALACAGLQSRPAALDAIVAPEPNPWLNHELLAALRHLRAEVTAISIYWWTLPDYPRPLREEVRRIADREREVVLFTITIQSSIEMGRIEHVRGALAECLVIGSSGPLTEALADSGPKPDVIPPQPKMAALGRSARAHLTNKKEEKCPGAATQSKR